MSETNNGVAMCVPLLIVVLGRAAPGAILPSNLALVASVVRVYRMLFVVWVFASTLLSYTTANGIDVPYVITVS